MQHKGRNVSTKYKRNKARRQKMQWQSNGLVFPERYERRLMPVAEEDDLEEWIIRDRECDLFDLRYGSHTWNHRYMDSILILEPDSPTTGG